MATEHKITAFGRGDAGMGASRRLRRAGRIPAIVYGGDSAPVSIELDHEKTWLASQQEWFYSSILSLELDGLPLLREAITYCDGIKDYTSGRLFKDILDSEEEHVDWIETQLDLINRIGEQNYLQSKMGG